MENKVKITVNGQVFEVPVDTSLITGLLGSMGMMMPGMAFPGPLPIPARPLMNVPVPIQTSHERLEESFFKKIEEDLEAYKDGSASSVVERILVALIALHKRVKRLENQRVESPRRLVLKQVMKPAEKPSKPAKPKLAKPRVVMPKKVTSKAKSIIKKPSLNKVKKKK